LEFKLLALRLRRRLLRENRARDYLGLGSRFVLYAIPLTVAIKLDSINFAATVGGILAVKLAVYYHFLIENRFFLFKAGDKTT
jgi:hypothetical protein